MTTPKRAGQPVLHDCPVCHTPQTKIQRKEGAKLGATNYVCSRAGECCLGINLAKVDTWVVV
jgi:ssDNA-binding Zn-finger/Zn-ribbon topoisomerase 1